MICPNCKVEYQEGFVKCSDCNVDLVPSNEPNTIITNDGIKLIKYGIGLLFVTFFELIMVIIAYEFYYMHALTSIGVEGTFIENVHPIIWILLFIQTIISLVIISWGRGMRKITE